MNNYVKMLRDRKKHFIKGNHISKLPFGYMKDNDGNVVFDENINVIKDIFKLKKDGVSNYSIAKTLKLVNDYGDLKINFVNWVLKNPFYCGYVRYDGKIVKGNHNGIVDEDTFLNINKSNNIEDFSTTN